LEEICMNSRDLARYLVLGGVIAGLSAGTSLRADQTKSNTLSFNQSSQAVKMADTAKTADKHACKGLNGCKGMGADGKNACKGQGSCASKEYKHSCAGLNACKGQGAGGKNECKGKGSCAVPPKASLGFLPRGRAFDDARPLGGWGVGGGVWENQRSETSFSETRDQRSSEIRDSPEIRSLIARRRNLISDLWLSLISCL
jgi:hypothetical protein